MQKVCLDKTLSLTRGIMNKDVQVPSYMQVTTELGAMDRFNFVNSNVEMPIEHIGLATVSYQKAVEQFTVTKVQEDEQTGEKTETLQFERLVGTGTHIADFLGTLSPDVLNWYHNKNGMLKMQYRENIVPCYNSKDYEQCKAYDRDGVDLRETAVREAYMQAMKGYVLQEIDTMGEETDVEFLENLHAFVEEDVSVFNEGMEQLKTEAEKFVLDPMQNTTALDLAAINQGNTVVAEGAEQ